MRKELSLPIEGTLAANLYGARASTSEAALKMRFEAMANQLERSGILFEFLAIMAAPASTAIAEWAPSTTEDRSAAARGCEACVDRDGPTPSVSATPANGASLRTAAKINESGGGGWCGGLTRG
jgi:hypothetical protein